MRITIDHAIRFSASHRLAEKLRPALTYPNPARASYFQRRRFSSRVPETWCALSVASGSGEAVVPRGALPQVMDALKAIGEPVEWVARVTFDARAQVVPIESLGVNLRDYQLEAVEACASRRQGVVCLPCGGGKTMVGAVLVAHLNQPSVVVAPTMDIRDQWVETLRRVGRGTIRVRVIGGDTTWSGEPLRPGEVAVGVDDSLTSDRAVQVLRSAGLLICDEAHRVASKTWQAIVSECAARWRIGLTATPERVDGWDILLPLTFGPVLLERSQRWLVERGYLAQPTVYGLSVPTTTQSTDYVYRVTCAGCQRDTTVESPEKAATGLLKCRNRIKVGRKQDVCNRPIPYDAVVERTFNTGKAGTRIAKDPARTALLVDLVKWAHVRERVVLVLLARVAAVPALVRDLGRAGIEAVGLTGAEARPARADALRRVREGRVRVVVATTVADEGLDLPEADTLVNANPGKASGTATQRVGRVCRPKGKSPLVFDLIDGGTNFARQWSARAAAYRNAYGDVAVPHRKPLSWTEVQAILARSGR